MPAAGRALDSVDARRIAGASMATGLGLLLWRGGIDPAAQWIFICAAAVAVGCARPALTPLDPIMLALAVIGGCNLAAYAVDGSASLRSALVACALAAYAAVGRRMAAGNRERVLVVVAALATTSAVAGLVAVALHRLPAAERIDGIWRAGGTLEYPPALAVLCVCGLAAVLGLRASGGLSRAIAAGMAGVLVAALALTYDRAGIALGLAVGLVWAHRRAGRRTMVVVVVVAVAAVAALAAVLAVPPGPLERLVVHDPLGGRWTVWREAWDALRARPFTGYGPGGFTRMYPAVSAPGGIALAHDLIVQQAIEAGVLAALGAVALMATGVVRAARAATAEEPLRTAFACIAITLIVSGVYDFTWSFPPLALLAALALGALPRESGSERAVVGGA